MSDPQQEAKRRAALQAVDLVESGMVVGLGTGSTAALVVEELGKRLREGVLQNVLGVPTSEATRRQAADLGIQLVSLEDHPEVDLTIDGADEVDRRGNLIKGLGGALLREKIVAHASRKLVIVVDPSKLVAKLGTKAPVPVEVVTFGWNTHARAVRDLGGTANLRRGPNHSPFTTDEGHLILDCRFPNGLSRPKEVERALKSRSGVVETGLFLDMRPQVIVGRADP